MANRRLLVYSIVVFALPILVAYWDLSVAGAVALVLVALLGRWLVVQSALLAPPQVPKLELETIAISHYSEKVRWCMDRLGVDYVEKVTAGILGIAFLGRTVPQLKVRNGGTRSVIGNSPEILRYLWGAYSAELGERAAFLEPTPERLELEARFDDYARDLQVWIYFHLLDDRALSLRAWGFHSPDVPLWQRAALWILFPLLRAMLRRALEITPANAEAAVQRSEALLADIEAGLADGRRSLLGSDAIDFADITFAAIASAWLQPAEFARGRFEAVRLPRDALPRAMAEEIVRWTSSYPRCVSFVERMFNEERKVSPDEPAPAVDGDPDAQAEPAAGSEQPAT